jgi:hypothetical protein
MEQDGSFSDAIQYEELVGDFVVQMPRNDLPGRRAPPLYAWAAVTSLKSYH